MHQTHRVCVGKAPSWLPSCWCRSSSKDHHLPHSYDIGQNLHHKAYTNLILHANPVIEGGWQLGLETTLLLAHACELALHASQNLSDSELDAHIQDVILSSPLHHKCLLTASRQQVTVTLRLNIQTNRTGFSTPNLHQDILVMNACSPTSYGADLMVQLLVVPPMGSPMAMQTKHPAATTDRFVPIPPRT